MLLAVKNFSEKKPINHALTHIFDWSTDKVILLRFRGCETTNNIFQNVNAYIDKESSLTPLFMIFSLFLALLNKLSSKSYWRHYSLDWGYAWVYAYSRLIALLTEAHAEEERKSEKLKKWNDWREKLNSKYKKTRGKFIKVKGQGIPREPRKVKERLEFIQVRLHSLLKVITAAADNIEDYNLNGILSQIRKRSFPR